VELLLRREAYDALADLLLVQGETLHAPHLLDTEVTQVLRRLEGAGTVSTPRATAALEDLMALRIVRHPSSALLMRVWELRQNLSAYDGMYVALAEALEAPLVTTDQRLSRAPGHTARVIAP
jgi:predicted nucleic acid-binding protein